MGYPDLVRARDVRALFVVTAFPSPGGDTEGVFHRTQAEALIRSGVAVDVAAPVPWVPPGVSKLSSKWTMYRTIPAEYRMNGVRVFRPRYFQVPRGDNWAVSNRGFARAVGSTVTTAPSVVHAHFAYPPGIAAPEVGRSWDVPTILTLHGSDVNQFPYLNPRTRRAFRRAVLGVDAVLTVSEALAGKTEALTGRRPVVMPIGINLDPYRDLPDKACAKQRLAIPLDYPVVLYVGRLSAGKGIPALLAALERSPSPGVIGVFVGDGPLKSLVEKSRLARSVGHQSNDRIPLFLAAADVFVLPSLSEGMPTVLIEAGAARVPVIATSVGGIPELLGCERGVLVPPGSVPELSEAISSVFANPLLARSRAERLSAYVSSHYDAFANARALGSLYDQLIDARKSGYSAGVSP